MSDDREQEAVEKFLAMVARCEARGPVQPLVPQLGLFDLKLVAARLQRLQSAGEVGNDGRQPTDGAP